MLPESQKKKYVEFYESARKNEILSSKTTLMIHMATAMALGCDPWMQAYFGEAREEGITDEEIGAVQSIVMAVSAGKVRAQFRDARVKYKKKNK